METPEHKEKKVPVPKVTESNQPVPEETPKDIPTPEYDPKENPVPKPGHPENVVMFGKEEIEIKPTKVKYQRDRTAAFYRILQQMPLVDVLALQTGMLDPERSSDKMFFDWLIAVTDDSKLVTRNYDELDSDTVEQILKIFCRINHIDEREERKNQQAQATKA